MLVVDAVESLTLLFVDDGKGRGADFCQRGEAFVDGEVALKDDRLGNIVVANLGLYAQQFEGLSDESGEESRIL